MMKSKMTKKTLIYAIIVSMILSTIPAIQQVKCGTVYDSTIAFNNTVDQTNVVLNSSKASVKFKNNVNATIHGAFSLNSTGGYSISGIANGTSYEISFLWDWYGTTYTLYAVNETTSATPNTNNTFGAYTIERLIQNVSSSGIAVLTLPTSANITSASHSGDVLTITCSGSSGVTTTTRINFNGVYDRPPKKMFIGTHQCYEGSGWSYDSKTNIVEITWTPLSSIDFKLDWREPSASGGEPSDGRQILSPILVIFLFLLFLALFLRGRRP